MFGSDGIFGFIDNETVMELGKKFFLNNDATSFCQELINRSTILWQVNDNIIDDITAVVVFFNT